MLTLITLAQLYNIPDVLNHTLIVRSIMQGINIQLYQTVNVTYKVLIQLSAVKLELNYIVS